MPDPTPDTPPCQFYEPWMHHGVQINECLEYGHDTCGHQLSPYAGQNCPWRGYPCPVDTGEARWKAPLKETSQ